MGTPSGPPGSIDEPDGQAVIKSAKRPHLRDYTPTQLTPGDKKSGRVPTRSNHIGELS
ncbi:hypothetical protein [Raineyella fluvialis]|uniref:Uncharacterized protein n=1 Tax=Raineyella fluvialis TaxID=2662261 RepID=A0A5Q2FBL7_9ACTN|nr:hypothetical protein [Raineyella fluvialis]QGF22433.1 hypothetical protein Rai3103_00615 [Raineyella fluvialis]